VRALRNEPSEEQHRDASPRKRPNAVPLLLGALSSLALLAGACGGGANPQVAHMNQTTNTTGAIAPGGGAQASGQYAVFAKYTACMRSHGVPYFPFPTLLANGVTYGFRIHAGPSGIDPSSPQFKTALAACRTLLPKQAAPNLTPADEADYLKGATCMRAHGIVGFPDPTFSSSIPGGVTFKLPPTMDPNSAQFRHARAICERLIPAGLPFSR
jgi:hypothetical protein